MAANQAPNVAEPGKSEGQSGSIGRDERPRHFEHNQIIRESLLRGQAHTESVQNAVENIIASSQWREQRGELDRFHLLALVETRQDPDGGETFHCRLSGCNYMNRESTNAVEHIRGTAHFGNRPFLCPDCEKAFTRKYDCNVHQQIHSSTRSFRCRYCAQAFTRAANQARHERNTHPEKYEDPKSAD